MAEAGDAGQTQCGYCFLQEGLEDPKSLPCGHVHCLLCLNGDFGVNNMLRCPWCG